MINRHTSNLTLAIICIICLFTFPAFSQTGINPWQEVQETLLMQSSAERQIIPQEYRTVSLDKQALKNVLSAAPLHHTDEANSTDLRLSFPMPDGTTEDFRIVRAPIMAPDLAARYPNIKSYAGQGIDDPTAYVRFGVTHKGFHAMILSARHSTVFIDAYAKNDTDNYVSYYRKNYEKRAEDDFTCLTEGKTKQEVSEENNTAANLFVAGGDCQLRTYRLALACTQEYATFHGGNKPDVLAEYNIAMARVNGVYETDFAVTMVLIDNTDDLIFLSEPDPYTNNNGGTMLGENVTTCNSVIGAANYDIGHVFSTGGGGIAGLGVPCTNGKARGVTGLGSPVNDPFYIDYVAHEIGHQFGANHTFNNSCGGNRNNSTAMEPGSASTIMGYAGICAPNVQSNSDPYFHAISLVEVYNYITVGSGSGCPTTMNMPNNPPVVTNTNTSYVIPASTPFQLTAIATDPDDNTLTYCWEQMDNEISTQAPQSTNTGGPNFRSLNPTESPTRYFPSIDNIINGTTDTWEVLSSVSRDMSFRCVVRDNNMGEGCTDEADVDLTIEDSAGPFLVLSPNTNITWMVGENQPVTWDVANTDQAPVACANVDILLSLDGGNTYPVTLASNVPNNGSFTVSVPNNITNTARVKVICSDNVFFDISNQNFVIDEPSSPTFSMTAAPATIVICNTGEATYTLDLVSLAGFGETTTLSAAGLPMGATATFSSNPVNPSATPTMTISNLGAAAAGEYTITINANSASVDNSTVVSLSLAAGIPEVQNLNFPANNETGVSTLTTLSWDAVGGATGYTVLVATSPTFETNSIVFNTNTTSNNFDVPELDEETIYYWTVSATSECGTGIYTSSSAFQTGVEVCDTYESTDVPVDIADDATGTVVSTLEITDDISFTNMTVFTNIRHTWVGDLTVTLTSPSGTTVVLYEQPGFPATSYGCGGDNVVVTLDDAAAATAADLENTCAGGIPTIEGTFQPLETLAAFYGESAQGTWTLSVSDSFAEDGGNIDSWSIFGCSTGTSAALIPSITGSVFNLPQGTSEVISNTYLQATSPNNTASQLIFTVITLPENGTLTLDGVTLSIGDTFTQEDINSGLLGYTHDDSATTTDSFDYSIINNQGGWLPQATFNINIIQDNLTATVAVQAEILCNGDSNGAIVATTAGGNPTFSYSLDGVNFQPSNTFTGLSAGSYTVTVRDAFGLETTTSSVTLNEPSLLTLTNDVLLSTITANANGGTSPYEFSINGGTYQSSNVFDNLINGTYTICALDNNDCEICTTETIAVNNISATATLTNAISCTDENDGTITIAAAGGQEPYSYGLNNGTPQSSNVFSFLEAGTYSVQVTDSDGFEVTTNAVTVSNPTAITTTNVVVADMITVTASGGTGTLLYSIDGGVTYQTSPIFTSLTNGSYQVCTIDENSCEICQTAVVAVNTMLVSAILTNDISCNDENDGTITVSAAGGQEPYSYSLNNGTPQSSNVFSFLEAGTYSVQVTDSDDFEVTTNTVTVSNPTAITTTNVVVADMITVTASGGTGTLLYSIDGGITYQTSPIFAGLANGSYQVCTIDENSCEICQTALIALNTVVVSATPTNDISCTDENDGTITVSAAGGQEPYSYNLQGEMPQASNIFTGLAAGTYTITVIDNDGFEVTTNEVTLTNPTNITSSNGVTGNTITVTASGGTGDLAYSINGGNYQISNIFANLVNGTYTICTKDENDCEVCSMVTIAVNNVSAIATLTNAISCTDENNGTITVAAAGGQEPYSYNLQGGMPQASNVFDGLGAGTYTITVIDSDGFEVTTNEVTLTNPTSISINNAVTGNTITVTASGGTGDLAYSINGGNYQVSNIFANLSNGTYTVCTKDENDCEVCGVVTIAVNNISAIATLTNAISCNNANDASITVNATGGQEPYSYSLNAGIFQDSNVFTDLEAGVYTVSVLDTDGFEVMTNEITITNPTAISATASVNDFEVTINANGGTGTLQYSSNGTNYVSSNVFVFTENGIYNLYIQDQNGCIEVITASVGVNSISANLSIQSNLNCNGGSDACIAVNVTGGTAPITYVLNEITQEDNSVFCGLSSGTYTVTVTDVNGFSFTSAEITIEDPAAINLDYTILCDVLTVEVSGGVGNIVIALDGNPIGTETILENGSYELAVQDENACTLSDAITVDNISIENIESEDTSCSNEEDGVVTISVISGGTAPYMHSINGGEFQSSNIFEDLSLGDYDVISVDANGCESTASTSVSSPPALTAVVSITGNNATVTPQNANGEVMYSIDGGLTFKPENTFLNLPNGDYTVLIQDENGCTTEVSFNINVTGINDLAFDLAFGIYPNPNDGTFQLLVNTPTENDLIVRVFDVAGKEIFRHVYQKNGLLFAQQIRLDNIGAGSYFVTVSDGTLAGTKKLVVSK